MAFRDKGGLGCYSATDNTVCVSLPPSLRPTDISFLPEDRGSLLTLCAISSFQETTSREALVTDSVNTELVKLSITIHNPHQDGSWACRKNIRGIKQLGHRERQTSLEMCQSERTKRTAIRLGWWLFSELARQRIQSLWVPPFPSFAVQRTDTCFSPWSMVHFKLPVPLLSVCAAGGTSFLIGQRSLRRGWI